MSRTKSLFLVFVVPIIISLLIASCNSGEKNKWEAINSGTFTALCDESLYEYLQPVFKMYDSIYKDINQTIIKTDARKAMAELLAGNVRVIILCRDYLKDEDSLMKKMNVQRERMIFAEDALVFFTQQSFPTDTLTDAQIKEIFLSKEVGLKKYYSKISEEPKFISNKVTSSEYANFNKLVLKNKLLVKRLVYRDSSEDVIKYVKENKNTIGIGFLSNAIKDTSLKLIRIAYTNEKGKYIFPHVVHQANIVQKYYPYIVEHFVYMLEKRQDLVYWFAMFMSREAIVQRYFKDSGIVPAYAKIKLIEQE